MKIFLDVTSSNYFSTLKIDVADHSGSLRHERFSAAQTLASWVQIPLEALMSVCVYPVAVLSCAHLAALRRTDPLSKESYRLYTRIKKLKKRPRSNKQL
jgi:hypothetical protein